MATAGSRWAVVMSRGAGFSDQVFELLYLSDDVSAGISFYFIHFILVLLVSGCGARFSLS